MSAAVDVLTVIDIFLDPKAVPSDHPAHRHDLVEARAAVAELIEAAELASEAMCKDRLYVQTHARLNAALARVGAAP